MAYYVAINRSAVVVRALVGIFTGYLLTLIFLAALGPLRVAPFVSEVQPGVLVPTAVTWIVAMAISMAASLTLPRRYLGIWVVVVVIIVIITFILASSLVNWINCGIACVSQCKGNVLSCSTSTEMTAWIPPTLKTTLNYCICHSQKS